MTQRFKKSVILGCLILASLMSFTYLNARYAKGMENKHLTAEMLISIMEDVDKRVLEIFRKLEGGGISVPDAAQTKYYVGFSLANDSATILDARAQQTLTHIPPAFVSTKLRWKLRSLKTLKH